MLTAQIVLMQPAFQTIHEDKLEGYGNGHLGIFSLQDS